MDLSMKCVEKNAKDRQSPILTTSTTCYHPKKSLKDQHSHQLTRQSPLSQSSSSSTPAQIEPFEQAISEVSLTMFSFPPSLRYMQDKRTGKCKSNQASRTRGSKMSQRKKKARGLAVYSALQYFHGTRQGNGKPLLQD